MTIQGFPLEYLIQALYPKKDHVVPGQPISDICNKKGAIMIQKAARRPVKRGEKYTTRGTIKKRVYEQELTRLQVELVKLQMWIKHKGLKIVVIFEGRDAAGKGGTIKRITESLNPRT